MSSPFVVNAYAAGSAERLLPVILPLLEGKKPMLPGYRLRVVDGNHLPATEKRLKVLRGFRGAALPGYALVSYDPDLRLITDLEASECAHAQERTLMGALVRRAPKGSVLIADRNLCTGPILLSIRDEDLLFAIREHGANPNPAVRSKWKKRGRTETGTVYEQKVSIEDENGRELLMRRIKLVLDQPTEDGEREIRILTNLPREVTAKQVASLYRERWSIEGMFQRLESVVKSEVRTLGNPPGALLAFGVSVLAYNVLSAIQTAVEAAHDLEAEEIEISPYYVAEETRANYEGMRIAVPPEVWEQFEQKSPRQLTQDLLRLARRVDPKTLRNHRRSKQKVRTRKGYAPARAAQRHISTAKALLAGRIE